MPNCFAGKEMKCRRRYLNPHALAITGFSVQRVCHSATPACRKGAKEYGVRAQAQTLPTRSSGCKLRGGPKISRKIIASRKPDADPSNAAMSILISGDLAIRWVANA